MKNDEKKIILAVQEGVLTGAFCSEPGFEVELWDFDHLEERGVDEDVAEAAFEEATHGMDAPAIGTPYTEGIFQ